MSIAAKTNNRLNGQSTLRLNVTERPKTWNLEYDPTMTFPEVHVGYGVTTQIVWLTPEMASEWLQRLHKRQRPQKDRHQRSLNEDHAAGRFKLNGETIIFDWDGALVDGRHRCEMVVAVGKPAPVLVVRNVAPEVFTTLDDSCKRTGADALKADAVPNATNLAAAAVLFERYRRGEILKAVIVLSPAAISELVAQHPGLVTSVSATCTFNEFPSRAALGMCHYVLSSISESDAETFFSRLLSGEGLSKTDPILTLRNRIYKESIDRVTVIFMVFKAWNYWRKRKPLRCLKERCENEAFPTPI